VNIFGLVFFFHAKHIVVRCCVKIGCVQIETEKNVDLTTLVTLVLCAVFESLHD